MKRQTAVARPAVAGSLRRAVMALFCLLAFSLQGYIAQSHIHNLRTGDNVALKAVSHAVSGPAVSRKLPALPDQGQDNPAKCPYCQVAASLSAMLGASALLITLPAAQLAVEPLAFLAAAPDSPPSHVWRSRGPPRS